MGPHTVTGWTDSPATYSGPEVGDQHPPEFCVG